MITNISKFFSSCLVGCAICAGPLLTSCEDMLESDSSRQVFEPELNQKTDTIFYALGILQGMQQLADQYVFQGEMRGDLVQTTTYTDNNLRQLANFSATTENKYDSAYVYYRVINNCNYYIAHVDTTLRTGSDYVMMPEYVAVKAIRAWTYMQLARVYGQVPFYTEPLTQISQIDNNKYPALDMAGIVSALAPDLEAYAGEKLYNTPNYGDVPNGANFNPAYIFMPVDVVLGEMYLETGDYARAANHYIRYLTRVADDKSRFTALMQPYTSGRRAFMDELPSDWDNSGTNTGTTTWSTIFTGTTDFITYIPMATSKLRGATTVLPKTFGYDFYATDKSGESRYIDEVQLVASQNFLDLSNAQDYYYKSTASTTSNTVINRAKLGDARYNGVTHEREDAETDSTQVWITKFNNARIPLFRTTTVWLHLAEAFNRLGMPDAAFAILKDGIHEFIPYALYMSEETATALTTTYPLLSSENISKFVGQSGAFYGIHCHGSGMVNDMVLSGSSITYMPGLNAYQMPEVVGKKMQEIADAYQVAVGTTKQDSINAMEDLLCDEYALEFAFEGTRFYDLARLARHKNAAGLYGSNFGSLWLARKLAFKNPTKDLFDPNNWYLPFK